MNGIKFTGVLLSGLLLAGCYTSPQRPAQEITRRQPLPEDTTAKSTTVVTPAHEDGVQISAYEPASRVPLHPLHSQAVIALLKTADQQERDRDLAAAVGTIERALRIEPRNAHLWNRLATLRFTQGRNDLATELAIKSLALSGGNVALKRQNWQLIAKAKRAAGDISGARVAERKARLLN